MTCQNAGIKQGFRAWRAAVDHVRIPDLVLLQTLELSVSRREHAKLGGLPSLPLFHCARHRVEPFEDRLHVVREAAVNDVDGPDGVAMHKKSETDVPVRLKASTKDGQGPDVPALREQTGGGQSRAEGRKSLGMDEADRCAFWRKERYGTRRPNDRARGFLLDAWVCQGDD
jgi:hypothetical protein